MKVIVVGLGVQGQKRLTIAGEDCIATVDPNYGEAEFRSLMEVPSDDYDAALICTPDDVKLDLILHLIGNGKHVLVEKPLLAENDDAIQALRDLANKSGVVCYTAYNHRFEPHFVRMKNLIDSGKLGQVYSLRMFYGNGTARLVRESEWRDQAAGVLPDLGSHLLDTLRFWFGDTSDWNFEVRGAFCHENKAFDHVILGSNDGPVIELEMTMLSWRNHFTCDIFAENGSAHISSLCKWGPSTFIHRTRVLPSGRPPEEVETLDQTDPTWETEYRHFLGLIENKMEGNLANDIWLNRKLRELARNCGIDSILPPKAEH